MTDTSKLQTEAAAISKASPAIRVFAIDEANCTVDLNKRLTALEKAVAALTPPTPPSPSGAWTWPAKNAGVDPNTVAKMSAFNTYALHVGGGPLLMADVAWVDAPAGTKMITVTQKSGTPAAVPSVQVPVPLGTKHSGTGDASLFIIDSNGVEYDLDDCNDAITSAFGVAYANPGSVNATLPGSGVNANAARFVSSAGLVTPAEMSAGLIPHALYFVMPNVGPAPNPYPADTTTGYPANTGLPLGSWVRLNPTVDVSGLPGWQRTVAVALQTYGMFLRDIGSSFHVCLTDQVNQGGNKADWDNAGVTLTGSNLAGQPYIAGFASTFPWNSLQLLTPPPKV